jgi:hypothetical protein
MIKSGIFVSFTVVVLFVLLFSISALFSRQAVHKQIIADSENATPPSTFWPTN